MNIASLWVARRMVVYRFLASGLIIAVVTVGAMALRGTLTLANFTLIYMLVVLFIAIRFGTYPALVAAFVSFLCLNFFFIQPYYTLIVADPRELLDLCVFLIVAALAGQLAARARQQAEDAQQRAYEQEILFRLTRAFNQSTTREGVFEVLAEVVKKDFRAQQAYILPYANEISLNSALHYVLLQANAQFYGTLCVAFDHTLTQQQERLLSTCASQAAMALHRIDLAERARKSQQFEEADKLKTAILHAVSHDLRTPITVIKTSASNLRTLGERLSESQRIEMSETIENEADHLDKLVGNLLDLSRLRAGALTLNRELNSLEEVSGDVAARVWRLTKQERIQLDFTEDMPLVSFDYGLLLQALTNVVDNALRYEPAGLTIVLRGSATDNEARLTVINHGEPIPLEEREHIMEPFYHGKNGHIGLGLAIAKGIIEAHHGRIWIEDMAEGATAFVIALPLSQSQEKLTDGSKDSRR